MHTWVLCQSLLQPAGRDAHAGDAPPESTEDLQRIQTLGQRPRVDAKVFEQAFNLCTKWWCQEVIPTLCNALHSVSVLSVRCARHFTDVSRCVSLPASMQPQYFKEARAFQYAFLRTLLLFWHQCRAKLWH